MPLSNSVLRRYTPPTCTLEIVAKSSPLSRWVGQSVLKDLRFELRFDDPRQTEDKRIAIRGDRTDLELLHDVVNSYVQDFLDQSPTQLPVTLRTPATAAGSTPDHNRRGDSLDLPTSGATRSEPVPAQASEEEPNALENSSSVRSLDSDGKILPLKPRTVPTEIYLQPKGLLAHSFFLGRLASDESGPVVDLSVLQLFDLATALEEYAAGVVALPNLNQATRKKAFPAWTGAAAAVLLAVGLTTAAVVGNKSNTKRQAAAPTTGQEPSPAQQTPLISQVPVAPTTPLPTTSLPTPVVPPPLSSSPILPPPSTVTIPPTPTLNSGPESNRQTISIYPPPTRLPVSPKRPAPDLLPGPIASLPTPSVSSKTPVPTKSPVPSKSGSPSPTANSPVQQSAPSLLTTPPPLPNLPTLTPTPSPPEIASKATPSPTSRSTSSPADLNQPESASAANTNKTTLFDNIPQVAEAREYLQQRWQPPSSLTQTLEYSLLLNADGTIQRIIPLGNAAGEYIDRTDIPLPGEPFVSPIEGGGNPIIRVVFSPDGKVKTFVEK